MKPITVVNKLTGEILEFQADKPEKILEAWRDISELEKALKRAKDKLKALIPNIIDAKGLYEHNGYQFRVYSTQRMTYDKAKMREVLDPDDFDLFLVPDKPRLDSWLKENINKIDPMTSSALRQSMIYLGEPYQTIKLEKL